MNIYRWPHLMPGLQIDKNIKKYLPHHDGTDNEYDILYKVGFLPHGKIKAHSDTSVYTSYVQLVSALAKIIQVCKSMLIFVHRI